MYYANTFDVHLFKFMYSLMYVFMYLYRLQILNLHHAIAHSFCGYLKNNLE